ncbi:hypothetical protein [Serratia ureilytica]|uniref:hypothetical protein n=1 Tax=Serratia ureilytica TaxID=300181 RepID=UPI0018D7FD15|nr:hypothetical protein [Serratia ureilytica]MBH3122420.1 hypothetical protein [Serratia ureilytica]
MMTILLTIYLAGIPIAFVLGYAAYEPVDEKKGKAGFVACEAAIWPLLLLVLYVAIPIVELLCLTYDRLVLGRRK